MRALAMVLVTPLAVCVVGCITVERAPDPLPDVGSNAPEDTSQRDDAEDATVPDTPDSVDAADGGPDDETAVDNGEAPDAGPFECSTPQDCDAILTLDACSSADCQDKKCVVSWTPGCCVDVADCPAADECHTASCDANACVTTPKTTGAPASCAPADADGDDVEAAFDNCPGVANPGQADADADGLGDHCDVCPLDSAQSCVSDLMLAVSFDTWSGAQVSPEVGALTLEKNDAVAVVGGFDAWTGTAAQLEEGGALTSQGGAGFPDWPAGGVMVLEAYVRFLANGTVLSLLDESAKPVISMEINSEVARCTFSTAAGDSAQLVGDTPFTDGQWHHVVCVDGMDQAEGPNYAKAAMIVDGRIEAAARLSGPLAPPRHVTAGGDGFVGGIDGLRVASRVPDYRWDTDMDGVPDVLDNCPSVYNRPQLSGSLEPSGYDCSPFTARKCSSDAQCDVRGACWQSTCGPFGLCSWQTATGPCGNGDEAGACEAGLCRVPVTDFTVTSDTELAPGHHFYGVVTVDNATLTCGSDPSGFEGQGCVIHADAVFLDFGGSISAEGQGFPAGMGPQLGCACDSDGEGGTHAGPGGNTQACALPYGDPTAPMALGTSGRSGVGCGGATSGAGSVQLLVNTVMVLNGDIELEGLSKEGTGGAGGSLLIRALALIGSGNVHVGGGAGGPGGSGGRAAIYADTTGYEGTVYHEGGSGVPGGPDGSVVPPELAD